MSLAGRRRHAPAACRGSAAAGRAPQRRPIRSRHAGRGVQRQSGDRGDDPASRDAVPRSARSGRAAARRGADRIVALLGLCRQSDRRHDLDDWRRCTLQRADGGIAGADFGRYPRRPIRCERTAACSMSAAARERSLRLPPRAIRACASSCSTFQRWRQRAQSVFRARGLGDRAEAFGGSFLTDPLPRGADIVSLVRVLHDHDDAAVMQAAARRSRGACRGRRDARRRAVGRHARRRSAWATAISASICWPWGRAGRAPRENSPACSPKRASGDIRQHRTRRPMSDQCHDRLSIDM